jgi:transcriptional regulator with XRE-family HTH domain
MKHDLPHPLGTLGADIRALRKSRGLRLADMAHKMGRSIGWLSQVERNMSAPSIADLKIMAALLDVSLSSLFSTAAAPETELGHVVRRAARRPIGSREAGLVEELLSPDLTDTFEVIHSTFEPGARLGEPVSRPTQEVGYIVSGQLDITISGKPFSLFPGDSFRIKGEPFTWMNPHADPCVVIWVIAPPVY